MKRITAGLAALTMFVLATPAAAQVCTATNPSTTVGPPASGEASLQSIVNGLAGFGPTNVQTQQTGQATWAAIGNPGSVPVSLVVEWAGNASSNKFGIWSGLGCNRTTNVNFFNGSAVGGASATLTWLNANTLSITGGAGVNTGTFSGIYASSWGLFIDGPAGNWSSLNSQNAGNRSAFVSYTNPNNSNDWVVGVEDWGSSAANEPDYNDGVLRFTAAATTTVPEPSTYLLMASGLLALGLVARRRNTALASTRA